jgi:biotin-(acetyl-CoA carboxylase) ligase
MLTGVGWLSWVDDVQAMKSKISGVLEERVINWRDKEEEKKEK